AGTVSGQVRPLAEVRAGQVAADQSPLRLVQARHEGAGTPAGVFGDRRHGNLNTQRPGREATEMTCRAAPSSPSRTGRTPASRAVAVDQLRGVEGGGWRAGALEDGGCRAGR